MMLNLQLSNRCKKDLHKMLAAGKSYDKFRAVIELLLASQTPDPRLFDHPLTGNWKGRRELHIEPDWLLIYKIDGDTLILERTGTHAHLFK